MSGIYFDLFICVIFHKVLKFHWKSIIFFKQDKTKNSLEKTSEGIFEMSIEG